MINKTEIDFEERSAPIDTLVALCENGPLFDGDIPSKVERDLLVKYGYACRISVNGEQGYNAATYKGNNAYCKLYNSNSIKEAKSIRLTKRALINASQKT